MSIRSMLVAAALASARLEAAAADSLRPIDAMRIDVGEVSGVAYYTIEHGGVRVIATVAQGIAGTSIRVVSVHVPGRSAVFSTPNQVGRFETRANGASALVRKRPLT
jgi:hypothetical protein